MAEVATVNPTILNALTLKWKRDRANFDDQQNRQRINYNSALDKMKRTYQDTQLKNTEGFADRGMLHSGPKLATDTKLRGEYNRQQAAAAEQQKLNLATIARRRLETDQEYGINKTLAALGLSSPAG